jgi:hypothetical protein
VSILEVILTNNILCKLSILLLIVFHALVLLTRLKIVMCALTWKPGGMLHLCRLLEMLGYIWTAVALVLSLQMRILSEVAFCAKWHSAQR